MSKREQLKEYFSQSLEVELLLRLCPGVKSFQETPKVEVADTVGAGDSFTGTFCASILKGKSIQEAHELAVKVSAYVCTQNGAMPQIPEEYTR